MEMVPDNQKTDALAKSLSVDPRGLAGTRVWV